MRIGSILENQKVEKRIAITPEIAKKYTSLGFEVFLPESYGIHLGFNDEEYKDIYGGFIKKIKNVINADNKILLNMKVLDVGCFTGDFLHLASKEGCDVTGYELQKEAVEIANQKLPGKIYEIDVYNNNIKTEYFDIVCLFGIVDNLLVIIRAPGEYMPVFVGTILIITVILNTNLGFAKTRKES